MHVGLANLLIGMLIVRQTRNSKRCRMPSCWELIEVETRITENSL